MATHLMNNSGKNSKNHNELYREELCKDKPDDQVVFFDLGSDVPGQVKSHKALRIGDTCIVMTKVITKEEKEECFTFEYYELKSIAEPKNILDSYGDKAYSKQKREIRGWCYIGTKENSSTKKSLSRDEAGNHPVYGKLFYLNNSYNPDKGNSKKYYIYQTSVVTI